MESRHHPCPVQRRVSHGGCGSVPDWSVLMLLGLPGAILVQPAPSSCSGGSVCVRLLLWFPSPSSLWFLAVVGRFLLFGFDSNFSDCRGFASFLALLVACWILVFWFVFQICWDLQGSKFSILHLCCYWIWEGRRHLDLARNGLVLVDVVASCRLLFLFPCWRPDSITVP
jgi:hypothetical protein